MNVTINIPDELVEKTVQGILENFPEAAQSLRCDRWKYAAWNFEFFDYETKEVHCPSKAKWIETFALVYSDKWPKGCTPPPVSPTEEELDNWLCACDADDFDAFMQLAIFGEVIFG